MLSLLLTRLAGWWAFTRTYSALRGLDPWLLADIGLSECDVRRISRKAMHRSGPISIYQLAREDFGEDIRTPVKLSVRSAPPARHAKACERA